MRTNGLTAPSCPVSSPQSATAAGARVRLGEAADAAGLLGRPAVVLRRRPPTPPRPAPPAPPPRAPAPPWRGRRRRAGVPRPGPGRRRRRARRCRARRSSVRAGAATGAGTTAATGDGTRAAAPRCVARASSCAGRLRAGAGQGDGTTGDGDGRHGRQPHAAQHGRGHGYTDGGCVRRMACAVPSRTPDQREREGQERAAASGGAMPSHDQPSGLDDDGWTSGSGGPAGGESRVHSVTVSS